MAFGNCIPFLFTFIMYEVMKDSLGDLQDVETNLGNGGELYDLDYADDVECLFESADRAQWVLDRFSRSVARFGM